MEVKACRQCGKLFQYISGMPICIRCKKAEEEMFQSVKEYLRENKGASLKTVSEETGVSTAKIERYIKEGRLEVSVGSGVSLTCERCGTSIYTGRLCNKCKTNLSNSLNAAAKSIQGSRQVRKEKEKEKMRFLDSYKKR